MKIWLCLGSRSTADLQHKRALGSVHSLLDLHCLTHVAEHTPSQHSAPPLLPTQSEDVVQACGHGEYVGLRHNPVTFWVGSIFEMVVQQISPEPVLHSELVAQE